jgi:hypothetical protein
MYASGASSFHLWIVEEFNNLKKAKPDATVDYVVSCSANSSSVTLVHN